MRHINHTYNIEFKFTEEFNYTKNENSLVSYDAYLNMEYKVKHLTNILNIDINSRQAICFGDGVSTYSCLSSIQFLIVGGSLYTICNFRSQHSTLGRPSDELMIKFLVTSFMHKLNHYIEDIQIICNVADYHYYKI